jgi:hypothetical protein
VRDAAPQRPGEGAAGDLRDERTALAHRREGHLGLHQRVDAFLLSERAKMLRRHRERLGNAPRKGPRPAQHVLVLVLDRHHLRGERHVADAGHARREIEGAFLRARRRVESQPFLERGARMLAVERRHPFAERVDHRVRRDRRRPRVGARPGVVRRVAVVIGVVIVSAVLVLVLFVGRFVVVVVVVVPRRLDRLSPRAKPRDGRLVEARHRRPHARERVREARVPLGGDRLLEVGEQREDLFTRPRVVRGDASEREDRRRRDPVGGAERDRQQQSASSRAIPPVVHAADRQRGGDLHAKDPRNGGRFRRGGRRMHQDAEQLVRPRRPETTSHRARRGLPRLDAILGGGDLGDGGGDLARRRRTVGHAAMALPAPQDEVDLSLGLARIGRQLLLHLDLEGVLDAELLLTEAKRELDARRLDVRDRQLHVAARLRIAAHVPEHAGDGTRGRVRRLDQERRVGHARVESVGEIVRALIVGLVVAQREQRGSRRRVALGEEARVVIRGQRPVVLGVLGERLAIGRRGLGRSIGPQQQITDVEQGRHVGRIERERLPERADRLVHAPRVPQRARDAHGRAPRRLELERATRQRDRLVEAPETPRDRRAHVEHEAVPRHEIAEDRREVRRVLHVAQTRMIGRHRAAELAGEPREVRDDLADRLGPERRRDARAPHPRDGPREVRNVRPREDDLRHEPDRLAVAAAHPEQIGAVRRGDEIVLTIDRRQPERVVGGLQDLLEQQQPFLPRRVAAEGAAGVEDGVTEVVLAERFPRELGVVFGGRVFVVHGRRGCYPATVPAR